MAQVVIKASETLVSTNVFVCNTDYFRNVVVVDVLDVSATFLGSDRYFDYWQGLDGTIYGL